MLVARALLSKVETSDYGFQRPGIAPSNHSVRSAPPHHRPRPQVYDPQPLYLVGQPEAITATGRESLPEVKMTAFNVKDLAARAAQRLAEHRQKSEARGSTFSTEPLPMDRVSSLDTNSMRTMSHSEDEHRHKSKMSRLVQKVRGRFSKRLAKREVIDE